MGDEEWDLMDEDRGSGGVAERRFGMMRPEEIRARLERARALPPDELARVLVDSALVLMAVRRASPGSGWAPLPPDAPLAA